MNRNQPNDLWQAQVFGQIYDTNFAGIKGWINEGAIKSSDKVRRGNLRWIEAGKIPALLPFFNAKEKGFFASDININHVQFSGANSKNCFIHEHQNASFQCEICLNGYCENCFSGEQNKNCPMCGASCRSLNFSDEAPKFLNSSTVNSDSTFADTKSAQNFGSTVRFPSDVVNTESKGISIPFVIFAAILVSVLGAYVWAYKYNSQNETAENALPEIAALDEKNKADLETEKKNNEYRASEKKRKAALKTVNDNQYQKIPMTPNTKKDMAADFNDQVGFVQAIDTERILKEANAKEREKIVGTYRESRSKMNFMTAFVILFVFSLGGLLTFRHFTKS